MNRVCALAIISVMAFSAPGVISGEANRPTIGNACLGRVFNLPVGSVTIMDGVDRVLMTARVYGSADAGDLNTPVLGALPNTLFSIAREPIQPIKD